jgi:hypothetical protein
VPPSLRQRRANQQSRLTGYRAEGDIPSGTPEDRPSTKLHGQIPRSTALAMIETPRLSTVASDLNLHDLTALADLVRQSRPRATPGGE